MTPTPRRRTAVAALLLAIGPAAATPASGQPPAPAPRSDVGFLQVGRAYLIRFPDDRHPVQSNESGLTPQPSGPPATWRANDRIDVLVVRQLGGGSWALLEHPTDPKAALEITSARNLLADRARVAEIEADPARRDFLARRREAAGRDLKTTRTWINLAHALSIADPPPTQTWGPTVSVGAP